jgi:hypothetical protein
MEDGEGRQKYMYFCILSMDGGVRKMSLSLNCGDGRRHQTAFGLQLKSDKV